MKWLLIILCSLIALENSFAMGEPLYVVNGKEMSDAEFKRLPVGIIKSMNTLSGEIAVEKYGLKGTDGVVEVTLHYDTRPIFSDEQSFEKYLSSQIKWEDNDPVAYVILKYRIKTDGKAELVEVMESTDSRLKKRVLKAFSAAPKWKSPAMNIDKAVEYTTTLRLQLPEGREMPRGYIITL